MKEMSSSVHFREHDGFPISIHRVTNHGESRRHAHDFVELVITLSGHGIHETETEKYDISAGDVFLIQRGDGHKYGVSPDLSIINVLFDPDKLRLFWPGLRDLPGYHSMFRIEPRLRREDGFNSRLRLSEDRLAKAAEMVALIEEEMNDTRGGYRFMAVSHLMHLICYLSRCYADMELPGDRPVMRLGNVLSFVDKHYNENITVSRLAKIAHMSETTLIRTYKKILNRSPMEHVIRTRISKAKELLQQDDLTITEVCFACGFNLGETLSVCLYLHLITYHPSPLCPL
jgi:AraC-like DNA-binding protein